MRQNTRTDFALDIADRSSSVPGEVGVSFRETGSKVIGSLNQRHRPLYFHNPSFLAGMYWSVVATLVFPVRIINYAAFTECFRRDIRQAPGEGAACTF